MSVNAAVAQIDAILADIEGRDLEFPALGTKGTMQLAALKTRAAATIERLAPPGSRYVADARGKDIQAYSTEYAVKTLAGILEALRADYVDGYMQTVEELIHADLFADLFDMAEELLNKGYKDAAAVIAGSALEAHIRKLAERFGISTSRAGRPVKTATLNDKLAATPDASYTKLTQKTVTAWLDLRNNAAHGRYEMYDSAQVAAFVRDIRGFIERYPA